MTIGKKGGRPTRKQAVARTLKGLPDELTQADVRRLLGAIAIDQNAPPTARVSALRSLLRPTTEPEAEATILPVNGGDHEIEWHADDE